MNDNHYFFNDFINNKTSLNTLDRAVSKKITCKWITSATNYPSVVRTYIDDTIKHSLFNIVPINIEQPEKWQHNPDQIIILSWEVINIHFLYQTTMYGKAFLNWIKNVDVGPIIFSKQDEHICNPKLREVINQIRPDAVITCTSSSIDAEKVYGDLDTSFYHVFPGYISSDIQFNVPINKRSTDILSRGRWLKPNYGRLGYLKGAIGEEIVGYNNTHSCGLNINHSNALTARVNDYTQWETLILNSKTILSTPIGCNVISQATTAGGGDSLDHHNTQYSYDRFVKIYDDNKNVYNEELNFETISPKMFQAAVYKTALVMYRHNYADIFKPDIHYIPVETDHSNLDDVVAKIKDVDYLQEMVDRVYEDIVSIKLFTYENLARFLDAIITKIIS